MKIIILKDTLGPLVFSQVPGRTAVDMGTAAVAELARHSRIIGLKDVRSTWLEYDVIACMYCSIYICFTERKLFIKECRCLVLLLVEKWCTWYWWLFFGCSFSWGGVFIKATGDLSRTQALREACPSDFLFYSGDDETGVRQVIIQGHSTVHGGDVHHAKRNLSHRNR